MRRTGWEGCTGYTTEAENRAFRRLTFGLSEAATYGFVLTQKLSKLP